MNYIAFQQKLKQFPLFSVSDTRFIEKFDNRRLVEWQEKGYIKKIRRGHYCFSDISHNENSLNSVANKIYSPSYISLESGLSYYGLIPEGVFLVTSISTKNTAEFRTPLGNFSYRHLKANLFFGYHIISNQGWVFKIGSAEKVILDYLYFKKIDSLAHMESMRFNTDQVQQVINFETLSKYQQLFNSKVLDKRVRIFKKVVNA